MEKINKPKWTQDGNRRCDTAERLNASIAPPPGRITGDNIRPPHNHKPTGACKITGSILISNTYGFGLRERHRKI